MQIDHSCAVSPDNLESLSPCILIPTLVNTHARWLMSFALKNEENDPSMQSIQTRIVSFDV